MKWLFFTVAMFLVAVTAAGMAGVGREPSTFGTVAPDHGGPRGLVLVRELEDVPDAAAVEDVRPGQEATIDQSGGASDGAAEQLASQQASIPATCYRIGPVSSPVAERLAEYLGSVGRVVDREARDESVVLGYWVIEPTRASRAEAANRVRELKTQGIDSFVFTNGELENAISLGLFKRREAAERHLDGFKGKDVDAQIVERTKVMEEVWLTVAVADADVGGDEGLHAFTDEGARIESTTCP